METGLIQARGKVAAFLDMGTNSVRLLVVRVDPGGVYTVLNQQREVVRLAPTSPPPLRWEDPPSRTMMVLVPVRSLMVRCVLPDALAR